MKIISKREDGELTVFFEGELDHHAAKKAISETNYILDAELPRKLTLDFDGITFMDSSGIAIIIGAYKKINSLGGDFSVINAPKQVYKVLNAAGITALVNVSEKNTERIF